MGEAHVERTLQREDDAYTLVHATRQGNRATERKEPTPEPAATPSTRPAPRHWTLNKELAHARTLAEHSVNSIQPYTEAAYVERMLQDWTKYETEVLEGYTGPPDTTSHTTWDDVVPDGNIGALATTVRTTFKDCSKPYHPFGDHNDPAITNAILAYDSWSTHLGSSSCMVKNEGKGRKMTGFQRHQKKVVLMDISKPSQTSMAK